MPKPGEAGVQKIRIGTGLFHAAEVGRDGDEVVELEAGEIAVDDRRGVEMIDRDIEETLNLLGVEIHREDTIRARGDDQIGH